MEGNSTVRGWYIRLNRVLRIIKRPISANHMIVFVTKDVRNAERLDPNFSWAIPVLFPGLSVDMLSSFYEGQTEMDVGECRVYIIWYGKIKDPNSFEASASEQDRN